MLAASPLTAEEIAAAEPTRPNVLLIMTDDQGFGDAGFQGNPVIRTPNLDRLASESTLLRRFYVSPVCAPTRASLLTGRYNYRTGVVDTYLGRAMMAPEETTIAEMLADAGYRTGIFGKWHLGDSHPMRPIDQGFETSFVHRGGGIGQPSDPPVGESYFDPILTKNGTLVSTKGYCTDLFTDAAIEFVEQEDERPFFLYLATNAPHTPLEVPDEYYARYEEESFSPESFPKVGRAIQEPKERLRDQIARVYAMVTNIDDNVGRLLDRIDSSGLRENTIVLFLTDNGPQQPRWTAGLRGRKGSVYEGGVRVPLLVRWPGRVEAGRTIQEPAAHIDIVPTLLEACGVKPPANVALDGVSLWSLLNGQADSLPARTLFFQWHRGDVPELYRAFSAMGPRFKLVQAQGVRIGAEPLRRFELFDIEADPYETKDLAKENPSEVARLKAAYEKWFEDVGSTRGYAAQRISIGSPAEPMVTLTRQDWRGVKAGWRERDIGHWEVDVLHGGDYVFEVRFFETDGPARLRLRVGESSRTIEVEPGAKTASFEAVRAPEGPTRVEAVLVDSRGEAGVHQIDIRRAGRTGS